jgi:hypothetical protein
MIKFISDIWKIDGFPLGCLISSIKKKTSKKQNNRNNVEKGKKYHTVSDI